MSRRAKGASGVSSSTKLPGAKPKKPKEGSEMPAFSISLAGQLKKQAADKQKMMRRNKPPGEDLKKLKEIMQGIKGRKITVNEYIGLIAPSTGDNADTLRAVYADEIDQFRKSTNKIYETMTNDINQVLTNENILLEESCRERHQIYTDKAKRCMNAVYQYIPDFDLKKFYGEKDYLRKKFPLVAKFDESTEEAQQQLRHESYVRYQWLNSENKRLKEENAKLAKRLNQLKKQQMAAIAAAREREMNAEEQRKELEEKQEELEEKLEELNTSVEKKLAEVEIEAAEKVVKLARKEKPGPAPGQSGSRPSLKKPKKPTWAEKAASEIEAKAATETLKQEMSKVSTKASQGAVKKRRKIPQRAPPPKAGETSPFHYSPPKTPQESRMPSAERQKSPFHYSPPRTPAESRAASSERQRSPFHYSPPKTPPGARTQYEEARAATPEGPRMTMTSTTTMAQEIGPQRYQRARAPKDTWGGFY